jgi:hypothetical protein
MRSIPFFLLAVVMWSQMGIPGECGDEKEPTFTTILKETDGGPQKGGEIVIQSEKEWKKFVETCQSETVKKKLTAEKVDFSKYTIVVVAEQNSSILGDLYERQAGVQNVTATDEGALIEYNVVFSDHLDTKPRFRLHVAKIAKSKKVTFRPSQKTYAG